MQPKLRLISGGLMPRPRPTRDALWVDMDDGESHTINRTDLAELVLELGPDAARIVCVEDAQH